MKSFLHVGCGGATKDKTTPEFAKEEWREIRFDINPDVKPDILGTMTDLSAVADASVDAIFSSHNIEYLYPHEVPLALKEFLRVLMPDGYVVLTCPDLQSVSKLIVEDKLTEPAYVSPAGPIAPLDILYGHRPALARGNLYMAHRCGFTQKTLNAAFKEAGFASVVSLRREHAFDLWVIASKCERSREELIQLAALHFPIQIEVSKAKQTGSPSKASSLDAQVPENAGGGLTDGVQADAQTRPLQVPVDSNAVSAAVESQNQPLSFFCPVFWGAKEPEIFADLMRIAAKMTAAYHFADNMFVFQRNNSMLHDGRFMEAWKRNIISASDQAIIWRRYVLAMAGFHCSHLDGDFVECGAYEGVGAKTVIDYLGGPAFPKTFWLYDMFEHNEKMLNHPMPSHGPELFDRVKERFSRYPNVKIFKGFLPDVLSEGSPEKIAYLHIDLNQAPAEIATLEVLFDRVVPGGMIILDDYEMFFYRAQKYAEDDWFSERGYKVFPLPTSQGFVIKR